MTVKVDGCLMDLHTQGQVRQVAIQGLAKVVRAMVHDEFDGGRPKGSMQEFVDGFFEAFKHDVILAGGSMTVEKVD